jgi:subtilisin family serine protease
VNELVHPLLDGLADADGAGVRVAVVDTGVDAEHPWVAGHLAESWAVVNDGGRPAVRPCEPGDPGDVAGHGTAAAGQVRRLAPGAELISVRVLDAGWDGSSEALSAVLRWLRDQPVHIASLSLSTMRRDLALDLAEAADDLYASGVTLVGARGYHESGRDYPTSFASVIGVTYGLRRAAQLRWRSDDLTPLAAGGSRTRVAWSGGSGGSVRTMTGSSFACPLVAGWAARMLSVCPGLGPWQVQTLLQAAAQRQEDGWWADWMDAADEPPKR